MPGNDDYKKYAARPEEAGANKIRLHFCRGPCTTKMNEKVLGLDTTDPLTGMIADWSGLIITAYVGRCSIEKIARIFRR